MKKVILILAVLAAMVFVLPFSLPGVPHVYAASNTVNSSWCSESGFTWESTFSNCVVSTSSPIQINSGDSLVVPFGTTLSISGCSQILIDGGGTLTGYGVINTLDPCPTDEGAITGYGVVNNYGTININAQNIIWLNTNPTLGSGGINNYGLVYYASTGSVIQDALGGDGFITAGPCAMFVNQNGIENGNVGCSVTFSQTGTFTGSTWGLTVTGTIYGGLGTTVVTSEHYTGTGSSITVSGLAGIESYQYDTTASGGGNQYTCFSGCSGIVAVSPTVTVSAGYYLSYGTLSSSVCTSTIGGSWSGSTCTLSTSYTISSGHALEVASGTTLVITGYVFGITNNGAITVDNGGTIDIENAGTSVFGSTGITNNNGGTITNNGIIGLFDTSSGGTTDGIYNSGTFLNYGTTNVDNSGSASYGIYNAGPINNYGLFNIESSSGFVNDISNGGTVNDYNCGEIAGTSIFGLPTGVGCTVTFSQNGILSAIAWGVTVGGSDSTGTGSSITVSGLAGLVSFQYASPVQGAGNQYSCTIGCSGTILVSPSNDAVSAGYYDTAATLSATTCAPIIGGTWSGSTCTLGGSYTISAGDGLDIASGTTLVILGNGAITNNGAITIAGTMTIGGTAGGFNGNIVTNNGAITVNSGGAFNVENNGVYSTGFWNSGTTTNDGNIAIYTNGIDSHGDTATGVLNDGVLVNSGNLLVASSGSDSYGDVVQGMFNAATFTNSGLVSVEPTDGAAGIDNTGSFTNVGCGTVTGDAATNSGSPIPTGSGCAITFFQTGIPSLTWGVNVGGTVHSGTGSSIIVSGLSGTVSYQYDSPVSGGTGIQYVCLTGCSGTIAVSPSTAPVSAGYQLQYSATQSGYWNDASTWGGASPPVDVASGATVTIPAGTVVTVPPAVTVTNDGTITVASGGTINNYGTISNEGTLENNGAISDFCGSSLTGTVSGNSPTTQSCSAQGSGTTTTSGGGSSSNQESSTGVGVTITGSSAPDGTSVSIYTEQLTSPSSDVTASSLSNAAYYDVNVVGLSDGSAQVCISTTLSSTGLTMQYWDGNSWVAATGITISGSTTICGDMPVFALTGTNIVIGESLSPPTVSASLGTIDQGQTSQLTSTAMMTGSSPYTYQWYEEAPEASSFTAISGAISSSYSFVTTTSTASGTWSFELQVTDSTTASVTSNIIVVQVDTAPSVTVSGPTSAVIIGSTANLGEVITGGSSPFTYLWSFTSFPSGSSTIFSSDISPTPSFVPDLPGQYVVTLEITDQLGYQVSASDTINAVCPAGSYDSGSYVPRCVPAPAGTYVPSSGATFATACSVGTYQPDIGQTSCVPAPAGYYVSSTGAISASLCPQGTFNDLVGQASCTPAPAGSYVSTSGATAATFCSAGTFSSSTGQVACTPAPAGSFVPDAGATSATQCAAGTYQAEIGQAECNLAPAGYYVGSTGATSATQCAAGTYSATTSAAACTPAPTGSYVSGTGAISAALCPVGTFSDTIGSSSCTNAPPGSYVPSTGAILATPCAAGTLQADSGQASCNPASAGSYVGSTGATSATLCALGTYQPNTGQTSCIVADPGYYVGSSGATQETQCPQYFTSDAGASSCYPIPVSVTLTLNPAAGSSTISASNYFTVGYTSGGSPTTIQATGTTTTFTADAGTQFTLSATTSASSSLEQWCLTPAGSICQPDSFATGSGTPVSETQTYYQQFFVTISSPYGTVSGQGWYNAGSTATFGVSPTTVAGSTGTQYVFSQWSSSGSGYTGASSSQTITVNNPVTETASWATQYQITFSATGLDGSASLAVATVNGSPIIYGSLPYTIWVNTSSTVTFNYASTISSTTSGKQFSLISLSQTSPRIVSAPATVTGAYQTQYLITFLQSGSASTVTISYGFGGGNSTSGSLAAGSGIWVDATTPSITFTYPAIVPGSNTGTQYSLTNVTPSSPIGTTGPATVTGTYVTQYLLTVSISPSGLSLLPTISPPSSSGWYNSDSTINLTANTVSGYAFILWQVDGTNGTLLSNTAQVTMNGPHYAIAIYEQPTGAIGTLISTVNGRSLQQGTQTSLDAKLSAALSSLNLGDSKTAVNQLNAFINEVNAQSGKNLTVVQAELLDSFATQIINAV